MPILARGKAYKAFKGGETIKSVMCGNKYISGDDIAMTMIHYKAAPEGTDFKAYVNNVEHKLNSAKDGRIKVKLGYNIRIVFMGKAGYKEPSAIVIDNENRIGGVIKYITVNDHRIPKAVEFSYTVHGSGEFSVEQSQVAPRISVGLNKDSGVKSVKFHYYKSPYEYEYNGEGAYSTNVIDKTIQNSFYVYEGAIIPNQQFSVDIEYGNKLDSISINNFSKIINGNTIITARTVAVKRITINCPEKPIGVDRYFLYRIDTEYGNNRGEIITIFDSDAYYGNYPVGISSKQNEYDIFECDSIQLDVVRKVGYKHATIGYQWENNEDTLTGDSIVKTNLQNNINLVINSGDAGVTVNVINEPLGTGEYVLISVSSEFKNHVSAKNPNVVYVGDVISIPLDTRHRKGTRTYRKPGVEIRSGTSTPVETTFTSDIRYVVTGTANIIIGLTSGVERVSIYRESSSTFDGRETIIFDSADHVPIHGYGPEESYFTGNGYVECESKRYAGDLIKANYISKSADIYDLKFSISTRNTISDRIISDIIKGNVTLLDNGKTATIVITDYNILYVSDDHAPMPIISLSRIIV